MSSSSSSSSSSSNSSSNSSSSSSSSNSSSSSSSSSRSSSSSSSSSSSDSSSSSTSFFRFASISSAIIESNSWTNNIVSLSPVRGVVTPARSSRRSRPAASTSPAGKISWEWNIFIV